MQYYRCKCGASIAFGSDTPSRCWGCSKCGTKLMPTWYIVKNPDFDEKPIPHEFTYVEEVQTDDGPKPLTRCRYCYRTQKEIEKDTK